jgi:hypothetical protein
MPRLTSNAGRTRAPPPDPDTAALVASIRSAMRVDSLAAQRIVFQAHADLLRILSTHSPAPRRQGPQPSFVSPRSTGRTSRRTFPHRHRPPTRAAPVPPRPALPDPVPPRHHDQLQAPFAGLPQEAYPVNQNTRSVRDCAAHAEQLGIPLIPGARMSPWNNAWEVSHLLGAALGGTTDASVEFPWTLERRRAVYDITPDAFSQWVCRAWSPRISHCRSPLPLAEIITGEISPLPHGVLPHAIIQVLTFQVYLMRRDYIRPNYPTRAILRVGFKEATLFPTPVDTMTELGHTVVRGAAATRAHQASAARWVMTIAKHCFCWDDLPPRGGPNVRHIGTDYFWAQEAAPAPGPSYSTDTSYDEEAEESPVEGGDLFGPRTF